MIRDEDEFNLNLPAGYDGKFDWDVFKEEGCWGDTKIEPMDFDGVVERHNHYLVFETKKNGATIPLGQELTLEHLQNPKDFTVIKLWPKHPPFEKAVINYKGETRVVLGHEKIIEQIKRWFYFANGRESGAAKDQDHPIKPRHQNKKEKHFCKTCGIYNVKNEGDVCNLCGIAEVGWGEAVF